MKKILYLLVFLPFSIWGQDSKVSDLSATTVLDSADTFYVIDGGTSKKVLWYYMAQTGFPVDVRTNAAGTILFEGFWLGEDAGINHTSAAYYNYGIGTRAHYGLTSGTANTALGYNAGFNITTGASNHFAGFQSGYGIDTARFNIALGHQSMYGSNGYGNIALGYRSAYVQLSGELNVFVGWESGRASSTADLNVGVGKGSLYALTTGDYNVAIGAEALSAMTTQSDNVAIGSEAAKSATGASTVTVGAEAGEVNTSTGSVFVGYQTGISNTSGVNLAIGFQALNSATTGTANTAIGYQAGDNATGSNNTMIGFDVADNLTTGASNTLVGVSAGDDITTGNYNTFIGMESGEHVSTNGYNVGIGYNTLDGITGSHNTIIGTSAGDPEGSNALDSNIYIGFNAGSLNTTDSQVLYIHNSSDNTPLIWGDFAEDSLIFNGTLDINDATNGRGITFGGDYSPTYVDRSATDYEYQNTHFGYQDLASNAYSPTTSEHGYILSYDSTGAATGTDHYQLDEVVGVASAKGMMLVAFDTVLYSNTSQTTIISLPVATVIHDIYVYVVTTFNGSGTDQLDIGITGSEDRYESNLDVAVAASFPTMSLTNIRDRMAGTTNITFDYDDSGADASAGMALVYVDYSIH